MKPYVVVLATVIALLAGMVGIAAAAGNEHIAVKSPATEEPTKAPKAIIPDPKFVFDPVVDGTQVSHDFSIKNTGDGPLAISRVKTG